MDNNMDNNTQKTNLFSIKQKLKNLGLTPKEITQTLILYKCMSIGIGTTGWVLCYRYRPVKMFLNSQYYLGMKHKIPKFNSFLQNTKQKIEHKLHNSKFVDFINNSIGTNKKDLVKSFVENTLLLKFFGIPLSIAQIYTCVLIVKSIRTGEELLGIDTDELINN